MISLAVRGLKTVMVLALNIFTCDFCHRLPVTKSHRKSGRAAVQQSLFNGRLTIVAPEPSGPSSPGKGIAEAVL